MCIATTRKPLPNRRKWSRQHPNGNKAQLDYVILTRKWINSLQNRPCYNTVEIDSDHHILTVTGKFSFRATKNTSNISMYINKSITSNDLVRNKLHPELSNPFENLQVNEDDTAQTAYNKLQQALIKTASNSLPKKEKNTNKPWISNKSL